MRLINSFIFFVGICILDLEFFSIILSLLIITHDNLFAVKAIKLSFIKSP